MVHVESKADFPARFATLAALDQYTGGEQRRATDMELDLAFAEGWTDMLASRLDRSEYTWFRLCSENRFTQQ